MARSKRYHSIKSPAFFAAALLLSFASPALADCAGSHDLDRCLIGTWHYANGGSAQWVSRNIHGVRVSHIAHNDINMTFREDGTFSTGPVDVHATLVARTGGMTGSGHATGQASGKWSAASGHLNICPTASSFRSDVTVNAHGHLIHVSPHVPTTPMATSYTCTSSLLTTRQPIAGHEPIVTTYTRAH